jgi:hypothetical protein
MGAPDRCTLTSASPNRPSPGPVRQHEASGRRPAAQRPPAGVEPALAVVSAGGRREDHAHESAKDAAWGGCHERSHLSA